MTFWYFKLTRGGVLAIQSVPCTASRAVTLHSSYRFQQGTVLRITPSQSYSPGTVAVQYYNPIQTSYYSRTVLQPIPLFLVQPDTWYTWYKPQWALCTALVQYYRLLVLSAYFIIFLNFLPPLVTHVTYKVGFNINSTVSMVTVFAPQGGLWFESCRWYPTHQVPFSLFLSILSLHQCHDLSSGHVILSYI